MKKLICVMAGLFLFIGSKGQNTELPDGWWSIPKTDFRLTLGGYAKLDVIYDFNPIASPDYFDVSKIPTDGSKGTNANLNAKETRLFLDVRKPVKSGDLRAYVEGDFYGSGGVFRMRHAYIEIGDRWLAGQTWSNFMDEAAIPPTLDFEKPKAYVFQRHAQLRFKHTISKTSYLAFALEQPTATGEAPVGTPGEFENVFPDVTGRYRMTQPWGHVQLSAFGAFVGFRPDTGSLNTEVLYGLNLSGLINVCNKDKLNFQFAGGPGIGRFNGGMSVVPDENNELRGLTDALITVGYLHWWNEAFSSYIMYNQGWSDYSDLQPSSDIQSLNYMSANVVWHFLPGAFAGIEYLRGNRKDISDNKGTANRIQMSIQYNFNMK